MNKHHPYNNIIEKKLEQLSGADTEHLWNDMHARLDEKMPQKKDRRRFIGWIFSGKGLLLLNVLLLIGTSSLFYLSTKENSTVASQKMPDPLQPGKSIESTVAKATLGSKENTIAVDEPIQKSKNNIPAAISLGKADDVIVKYSNVTHGDDIAAPQTNKQYKITTAEDQSGEPMLVISKPGKNFDIVPANLKSASHDFSISTDHNKEIDSLIRKAALAANNVRPNTTKNNERGFYTGIISGVDLSSIHFRSVKTGSTKGFIIGYAFNNKWSLESGLLWDTKRVYDDGKFFNPPGYTPSGGVTIVAVNGKNRLFELPLNVKYTIIPGKHNLFATTGLSSYFMRSENYDYEYTQNGQPGGHNYLSYKNATNNWFSVINFSMGYTHKIGKAGSLRAEPYLKLPMKNIGVGKMPIMSTGLNIGFIKTLR